MLLLIYETTLVYLPERTLKNTDANVVASALSALG
jgi:hypothetical protein